MEEKKNLEFDLANAIWKERYLVLEKTALELNQSWFKTATEISEKWSKLFGRMNKVWLFVNFGTMALFFIFGYALASL